MKDVIARWDAGQDYHSMECGSSSRLYTVQGHLGEGATVLTLKVATRHPRHHDDRAKTERITLHGQNPN